MKKIIKLTESDLARIVRRVITEESANSYTVKNDTTLENSNTAAITAELKLFKGATFTKVPGAKELVANTKYQFVDSSTGQVASGPNAPSAASALALGPIGAVGSSVYNAYNQKTYSGKVTYYCGIGKFKVKESADEYFDEGFGLANMLKGACNAKDTPVTDPIVTPKSNHVCDTDPTSKLHPGKNFRYCKNGEKYYFKGVANTTPEFAEKYPNWTLAKGTGLESIKKMIGPVFDKM